MRKSAAVAALALGVAATASAQGISPGKYSGSVSYVDPVGKKTITGIELRVDKVEGSALHGTATRYLDGSCRGEVPVTGTIEGDKLTVRPVKDKFPEGCGFRWDLKADGRKLEGRTPAGAILTLSK